MPLLEEELSRLSVQLSSDCRLDLKPFCPPTSNAGRLPQAAAAELGRRLMAAGRLNGGFMLLNGLNLGAGGNYKPADAR